MLRLILTIAIALTSPAPAGLAQPERDHTQSPSRGETQRVGETNSFDDLHDRIDRAEGVSEADKERLHERLNAIEAEKQAVQGSLERIQQTNSLVDDLQAEGLIPSDPAEKAKIESEVRTRLDRIEEGRSTLEETRRNLEAEIEASEDLTREQKDEARSILRDLADKRITEAQARLALSRLGDGAGYGGSFVLILVLFILLVIIGAGFG